MVGFRSDFPPQCVRNRRVHRRACPSRSGNPCEFRIAENDSSAPWNVVGSIMTVAWLAHSSPARAQGRRESENGKSRAHHVLQMAMQHVQAIPNPHPATDPPYKAVREILIAKSQFPGSGSLVLFTASARFEIGLQREPGA